MTVEVERSGVAAMDDPRHLEYYGGLFGDDQQFDHMGICARAHARVVAGGDGHRQPVEGVDDHHITTTDCNPSNRRA